MHAGEVNDVAIQLCAEGESNLQAALHAGLGQRWNVTETLGWAPTGAPHPLLFSAVTLTEDLPRQALPAGPGTICDSFASLRPDVLPGRRHEPGPPWMLRDPEPLYPGRLAEGLQIRRVTEDREVDIWEELVFRAHAAQRTHPGELPRQVRSTTRGWHSFWQSLTRNRSAPRWALWDRHT